MSARLVVGFVARDGAVFCHVADWVCGSVGRVVHAVDATHAADWAYRRSRRRTWDTVCGVRAYPCLPRVVDQDARSTVAWPPRLSGLAEVGWGRCVECHRLTGRKRPRTELQSSSADRSA